MSLRHVYISHAGPDAAVATTLASHIRNAGHDTRVDTLDLSIGDNVIDFMNDGIHRAHTVVILLSRHLSTAPWQKLEIDSAIWNEHAQNGGRCLVIRLDESPIPPLLGPKIYGTLDIANRGSLQTLVEQLCRETFEAPGVSSIVADALQRSSRNPFRHLRAEFFEDRPDLHARAFAPPDPVTLGSLQEMKPTFLEGTRGSGKSMLLLSLRARNYLLRTNHGADLPRIFGLYLKLTRGAICNAGFALQDKATAADLVPATLGQLTDLSEQELVLQLTESLFSELSFCSNEGLIKSDKSAMKALVRAAASQLFEGGVSVDTLEGLLDLLADTHKRLAAYIRRRFIYDERPTLPVASFDLQQLKRTLELVARHIPLLNPTSFFVLLDEYENLLPYQQQIVNTFVKLGPPHISVKIAKKLASDDTSATTTGQELQETHDYNRVPLVHDLENAVQRTRYYDFLRLMVTNLCACEDIPGVDVDRLLPKDTTEEVAEDRIEEEVAKLAKVTVAEFREFDEERRREKMTYYREAAIYRVLLSGKGRHRDKRFSGFAELAFVSSGVIRYFQEILGVAYHLSFAGDEGAAELPAPLVISPEHQSRAVHIISQHNLTTLSRNVERHGEELKYFLLDLGDCLRHKLLKHTSEPEAARLTIQDPEMLSQPEMAPLRTILSIGMREGVFQTKEGLPAFKPKHSSDPQPSEFAISRIFAPVLQLSPRLRWRTTVTCESLLGLAKPGNRAKAMQELKAVIVRQKTASASQISLLEGGVQ